MRNSRSSALLGKTHSKCVTYVYRGLTLYAVPSQILQLHHTFITRRPVNSLTTMLPQPRTCNTCQLSHTHGLACSAFARHYSRNHCCFLFLWVLRCFTSPRSLYPPYIFRRESPGHTRAPSGVSPFGHPRITARLSAPRGLSQIATSFFGSRCQGIHRLLLKTCKIT